MKTEIAFIFPGQGSQRLGMLQSAYQASKIVRDTFAEANEVLKADLWQICQRDEVKLNQTQYTQPVLLAASVALWRAWQVSHGDKMPSFMAGHSLGEYSALVCAGAIQFVDAVGLVAKRGELMSEAVPSGMGAMAAIIGLDDASVITACEKAANHRVVSAVNFNSPGQVVIAGEKAAVEDTGQLLKEMGAKRVKMLPVSVPSHCALMQPAAEKLAEVLSQINIASPKIPVVHNVDVAMHKAPEMIREALIRQLYSPVRWMETIEFLIKQGVTTLIECGPGKVLTGLNKRIDRSIEAVQIEGQEI